MYKAVFIDIDGTLLRSDHSISRETIDTVARLKEKNIMVVLVSARPLHGIIPIANETGLLHAPIASLNGAYISIDEQVIFESVINIALTGQVQHEIEKRQATGIYYHQMQWFCESGNKAITDEQKITAMPVTIEPFSKTWQYWQSKNTGPNKILMIAEADIVAEMHSSLQRRFNGKLHIAPSKPTYLEIMDIGASKLNAVQLLIEKYQIEREAILAIGDNFNDKEMIAFAGTGIAMANAPGEVKAAADYITDSNDDDGVPKALAKFIDL